jgi:hypothetical protein
MRHHCGACGREIASDAKTYHADCDRIGRVAHLERLLHQLVTIIEETPSFNSHLDFNQSAQVCNARIALQNATLDREEMDYVVLAEQVTSLRVLLGELVAAIESRPVIEKLLAPRSLQPIQRSREMPGAKSAQA